MFRSWFLSRHLLTKSGFVFLKSRTDALATRTVTVWKNNEKSEDFNSKREKWMFLATSLAVGASVLGASLTFLAFKLIEGDLNLLSSENTRNDKIGSESRRKVKLEEFSRKLDALVESYRVINGMPGIICQVHIGDENVFKCGFGYCNVEHLLSCDPDFAVFRIASISKLITGLIAIKLVSEGKLDLDEDIRHYLPTFPSKVFDGMEVQITSRHLLNHRSGIRHYEKPWLQKKSESSPDKSAQNEEIFCNEDFVSLSESIKIFQDDPLVHKPGTEFLYSTYGFVLLSAVLEKLMEKPFHEGVREYLLQMGLVHTRAEPTPKSREIVSGRIQGYMFDEKKGKLSLCPEITIMHKTAGGGIISNLSDLCVLGKRIVQTFQRERDFLPGVKYDVFCQIVNQPGHPTELKLPGERYSLGFTVLENTSEFPKNTVIVGHGGNAVGMSSHFLVAAPNGDWNEAIVVAVAANIKGKSLSALAKDIVHAAMLTLDN